MRDIIIVPCYASMPERDVRKQAAILNESAALKLAAE
jgi:hypothetical protein